MSEHQNDQSDDHQKSKGGSETDANPGGSSLSSRSRLVANPRDIICGRGYHIVNHRGNFNLHLLVNSYREEYLVARRSDKTKIIKHVLRELKAKGARFIRKVSNDNSSQEWEEVDDDTAYKKVSHALRLRTENESNRDNGSMAAGEAFHHVTVKGARAEQRTRKKKPLSLAASQPTKNESEDAETQPSEARREPSISIASTDTKGSMFASLGTGNGLLQAHQLPIPNASYNITFPSNNLYNQGLQDEGNHQAYWNLMYTLMQQSRQGGMHRNQT